MSVSYIVDTNVIVRYLINDNQELFTKAKAFFDKVKLGEIKCYLEQTVFTEVIFVLSNFYQIPREAISNSLANLLQYKGLINEDKTLLTESLELYKTTNLHIVDCILGAKVKEKELKLMSFDQELLHLISTFLPT